LTVTRIIWLEFRRPVVTVEGCGVHGLALWLADLDFPEFDAAAVALSPSAARINAALASDSVI
jgi:hypothetical protein